jgi:hypothetical protein
MEGFEKGLPKVAMTFAPGAVTAPKEQRAEHWHSRCDETRASAKQRMNDRMAGLLATTVDIETARRGKGFEQRLIARDAPLAPLSSPRQVVVAQLRSPNVLGLSPRDWKPSINGIGELGRRHRVNRQRARQVGGTPTAPARR